MAKLSSIFSRTKSVPSIGTEIAASVTPIVSPTKKAYILDTSTIIHDPMSFLNFEENDVFLPLIVLNEIDNLRKAENGRGRNAREFVRQIDAIIQEQGTIEKAMLPGGGRLGVLDYPVKESPKNDLIIIGNSMEFLKEHGAEYTKVCLVSKDIGLRVVAHASGIMAENYENDIIGLKNSDEVYTGVYTDEYIADPKLISEVWKSGYANIPEDLKGMLENQFATILCGASGSAIVRRVGDKLKHVDKKTVYGVTSKNARQHMGLELLMDPTVHLVVLFGPAGTGKTLISLAAGLAQAVEKSPIYDRLICMKPIIPCGGKDLGALPGTKEEKLSPWLAPYFDNLGFLGKKAGMSGKNYAETLMDQDKLELEAMTYIRGRSIPNTWIILDESQNLSPRELKTALTRTGEGSKVIVLADPSQIDTPYLDRESSGVTRLVEKLKGNKIFGAVAFDKSERSELAALVAEVL